MKLLLLLLLGVYAQEDRHKMQTFDTMIDAKDYTNNDSDIAITQAILAGNSVPVAKPTAIVSNVASTNKTAPVKTVTQQVTHTINMDTGSKAAANEPKRNVPKERSY